MDTGSKIQGVKMMGKKDKWKQWTYIFSLAFTARKFFLSIFEFPYTPYFI